MIEGKIRDVCYALNDEGRYTSALSMGWDPKNEAIKMAWEEIFEQANEIRKEIIKGKLSPVAFYMKLNAMDISILSGYSGIPVRKVKKHLQMKHFLRLKPGEKEKYAGSFNISVSELDDIDKIKTMKLAHED